MRLVIVSNRLPVTAVEKGGKLKLQRSSGGLVSGLDSYLASRGRTASDFVWIGWPGLAPSEESAQELRRRLLNECAAQPVFVSEETMNNFYDGFCNKTIWPLFHYFPTYASFEDGFWDDYKAVNERYCEAILEVLQPGDVVWIHDYHLLLLPLMLRKKRPELSIGFFLHIPFPSFEIFRLLPPRWRSEILEGMLGADLVGFHTHDYTQYFLRCVLRILGHDHALGQITVGDRLVLADTFPMGIDYARFRDAAGSEPVLKERRALLDAFAGRKLIVSVDRLDYTKGILHRLQGFEKFLADRPEWHARVVLYLVLVPSRVGVDRYRQMKKRIDETVGMINGRFGTAAWTPIIYLYRSLSFVELVGLYSAGDAALITPLRDGMNLIAKEYIASHTDMGGVLVLSEMAGASRELGEALIINPTIAGEVATAIRTALEMPRDEQTKRNRATHERLQRYDVLRWGEDFLEKLKEIHAEQAKFNARVLAAGGRKRVIDAYCAARRRLLLLDYDGTLVGFSRQPEAAVPNSSLLFTLSRIVASPRTRVVIVSGRPRQVLEAWFGELRVGLIAEHGAWLRETDESEWRLIKPLRSDWKAHLLSVMKMAADRLPGAFVEEKEYSLVWHYRRADPELASLREKELTDSLVQLTANMELSVVPGHRIVEVKNSGVSKGSAALQMLDDETDFVLAAGDDTTDEEMFRALPQTAYTIRVGMGGTHARFNLPGYRDVLDLLAALSDGDPIEKGPTQDTPVSRRR